MNDENVTRVEGEFLARAGSEGVVGAGARGGARGNGGRRTVAVDGRRGLSAILLRGRLRAVLLRGLSVGAIGRRGLSDGTGGGRFALAFLANIARAKIDQAEIQRREMGERDGTEGAKLLVQMFGDLKAAAVKLELRAHPVANVLGELLLLHLNQTILHIHQLRDVLLVARFSLAQLGRIRILTPITSVRQRMIHLIVNHLDIRKILILDRLQINTNLLQDRVLHMRKRRRK